ncbi:CAP domain-containing protein [Pontibacillus yanchengensis]|uniref:SCP domain-containing protein n=1 Tax=Pontibacillus yanchengensis Y32 TaxID=1385514 RepID=A0A0A2T6J4_9BACI|nr:CAP domain-containing protein [Pontibacillus yanchengensis]KGP71382.1 hypothetical protein N782_19615 [Pontibacillus yanchengensis Y32]
MKKNITYACFALLLGFLLSYQTVDAESWNDEKNVVGPNKVWTVTFNVPMNEEMAKSIEYVTVENSQGKTVPVKKQVEGDKVIVTPFSEYDYGESYQLVIRKGLESEKGKSTQETVTLSFSIQEENSPKELSGYEPSAYEREVLQLVNKERTKRGIQPLDMNSKLSGLAHKKGLDMAENNYFSHTSPTYGSPFEMMKEFGFTYVTAGENIAAGQHDPEAVVSSWMNSDGHRANILNENFTELGVGYVQQDGRYASYWVQLFMKPKSN